MRKILQFSAMLALISTPVTARDILFIGNSFTFGNLSAARQFQVDTVHDLNGPNAAGRTFGGVPAIFKAMTKEAGLDYNVSLEAVGGKGLDFHYREKLPLIDRRWDDVVLQSYSTLDADKPGDPTVLVKYAALLADTFTARNPKANVYLTATWSRADLTYPGGKPWSGKPIEQMALDVADGYEAAFKATPKAAAVIPVGLAFNRAFAAGFADTNPYDGIAAGQVNLWAFDNYHASTFGYYLEALMIFGKVTGRDPLSLGDHEMVGDDFGFSPAQIHALQQIAHDELAAHQPSKP